MTKRRALLLFFQMCLVCAMLPVHAQTDEPATATPTPCQAGFHQFDHEYLATEPVCIPNHPKRIVALDMAALELLFYTDKEIVGSTQWILDEMSASLPQLRDRLLQITDLGYPVNSEAVLLAKPDLILAYAGDDNLANFDELKAIAPVVITSLAVQDWERTTEFWSEVLGVQDTFDQLKANYDARITELQAALGDGRADLKVSLTTADSYGIVLWMLDSPQGKILNDVGVARPETQISSGNPGEYWLSISEEKLDMADGDVIFLFAYATTDPDTAEKEDQALADFQQTAVWNSLNAVQADNVHVEPGYWYRASTYLIANRMIDDLFRDLAHAESNVAPITPNDVFLTMPQATHTGE